jgi:hypothetical protein
MSTTFYAQFLFFIVLLLASLPAQGITTDRLTAPTNSSNSTFVWVIEDIYQGKTFFEYVNH